MPQWWWFMVSFLWSDSNICTCEHTHTFNFLSYYKTFPVRSSIYIPTRNLWEFGFTVYSQIYRSTPPPLLRLVLFMESWDLLCRQGWLPACESSCLCLLRTKSIIQDMCSGKLRTSCMLSAHYTEYVLNLTYHLERVLLLLNLKKIVPSSFLIAPFMVP